jgi:hypothetical protein
MIIMTNEEEYGDPELKKEAAKVAPRQNSSGIGPSGF